MCPLLSAPAKGWEVDLMVRNVEPMRPTPIPWLRLGLANIITLLTLHMYGLRAGMTVTLTRVIIRSLIAGTFLGPAFVMSLGSGVASTLVIWGLISVFRRHLGIISLSVFGAITHNIVQLFLAYFLFIRRIEAILIVSPVILLFGIITGIFNGIITNLIIKKMQRSKDG